MTVDEAIVYFFLMSCTYFNTGDQSVDSLAVQSFYKSVERVEKLADLREEYTSGVTLENCQYILQSFSKVCWAFDEVHSFALADRIKTRLYTTWWILVFIMSKKSRDDFGKRYSESEHTYFALKTAAWLLSKLITPYQLADEAKTQFDNIMTAINTIGGTHE